MLKTMKVLLLAGVLGGIAASPTLAQSGRGGGGGGGHFSGGGGHSMGGGGAIYPRMGGGGGGHSFSGGGRSFGGGGGGIYMRRGGDFSRQSMRGDFSRQGMRMEHRRALAQPGGGDFPRERFRRGDRPDRFVRRDNDFRRFDRNRFDRRHGRFDDDGRHHKRFRHRTGAFVFFNNGWWYDDPWWTYDTAYVGGDYGDAHVQWCINQYRSYNPDNNTFVSYGGDVRECVSPYGP